MVLERTESKEKKCPVCNDFHRKGEMYSHEEKNKRIAPTKLGKFLAAAVLLASIFLIIDFLF